jgi:hypothetical protein
MSKWVIEDSDKAKQDVGMYQSAVYAAVDVRGCYTWAASDGYIGVEE